MIIVLKSMLISEALAVRGDLRQNEDGGTLSRSRELRGIDYPSPYHGILATKGHHHNKPLYEKEDYQDDPFKTPFCNPSGECGEKANVATPRTKYSSMSKENFEDWHKVHHMPELSPVSSLAARALVLIGSF